MERAHAEFAPTTAERIARNDDLFRTANEQIRGSAKQYGFDAPVPFICECAEPTCQEIVRVDLGAYERIRMNPRWFLNAPGHDEAAHGHAEVVSAEDGYVIVEKIGVAGEIAEELDERGES